jgi:copper chaperone CopZ
MAIDDGLKTVELYVEGMHCQRCVNNVGRSLSRINGVESCAVEMGHAWLTYLPQLVSHDTIERAFHGSEYTVHFHAPRRNAWQRVVNRLIRSNEKLFGGKTPDCCTIVRDQNDSQLK